MSFAGPPPQLTPPSGPFEAYMSKIASSPYAIATAIFLLNIGGRFLPMEVSKQQEQFLNQPWFRRFIIFVIFFVATRNLIMAMWLSLIVILFVGYLFNENSSLCLFGKAGAGTCKSKTATQSLSLTPEEQAILKSLQDKANKLKVDVKSDVTETSGKIHDQYQKVMRGLWVK